MVVQWLLQLLLVNRLGGMIRECRRYIRESGCKQALLTIECLASDSLSLLLLLLLKLLKLLKLLQLLELYLWWYLRKVRHGGLQIGRNPRVITRAEGTQRIFEDDSLRIPFALSLRFDAVIASWLLLSALDAPFSASWWLSVQEILRFFIKERVSYSNTLSWSSFCDLERWQNLCWLSLRIALLTVVALQVQTSLFVPSACPHQDVCDLAHPFVSQMLLCQGG